MLAECKVKLNPIGSFFNFPNWRYQIYLNPAKASLLHFCRKPKDGDSCLNRYTGFKDIGSRVHVNFTFTNSLRKLVHSLDFKQSTTFHRLFNRKLKDNNDKKLFCQTYKENIYIWKISKLHLIDDEYLQRLLKHTSNYEFDKYIQFAVGMYMSPDHQHIYKYIGYCIFAGMTDNEIAKKFKLFAKQIEAIRHLFFDFTNTPNDPTARAAYLTQLVDNGIITDLDKRFYKLVSELGELGLRAQSDFHSLVPEEKLKVQEYLGNSMLDNVLSLSFSVTNMKDAFNFNTVINSLASFYIKKEEVNYFKAKIRNLDASTHRIENDKGNTTFNLGNEDDQYALELISKLALKENAKPEYKTITELN